MALAECPEVGIVLQQCRGSVHQFEVQFVWCEKRVMSEERVFSCVDEIAVGTFFRAEPRVHVFPHLSHVVNGHCPWHQPV